jgi:para-aminobenzoate synthetase component 1
MKTPAKAASQSNLVDRIIRALPHEDRAFLLDSPPGCAHDRNLPYSWADGEILFGWGPGQVLQADTAEGCHDSLQSLDRLWQSSRQDGAAIAVGYISYDMGGCIEPVAASALPEDPFPLVYFAFYDRYFAYNPVSGRLRLHHRGHAEDVDVSSLQGLPAGVPAARCTSSVKRLVAQANFTMQGYVSAVEAAREYILAGDIYEVNLSQRVTVPYDGCPGELYLRLRTGNPAPYAAFLSVPGGTILSSSPELFLRVEGDHVVTRPIKGTIRRHADPVADELAACALAASVKDNAELAMIVDLERNDLGRVCRYGSVKVLQACRVETFSRVHHLVSTIEGRLSLDSTLCPLIAATFPGGSITGAPKIRAMQIIDELEPCRRGLYTGAIGYVLPGRRAEFNIAIRTFLHHGGRLLLQVGGAVTADSDPEAEYQETLAKAEAMLAVVGAAFPDKET